MKFNKITVLLPLLLLCSCVYDYDMDLGDYVPQVVVNSKITPDSTIKVVLNWSKEVGDKSDYKTVKQFNAKIYEDENLIYDEKNINDSIVTNYYPKGGSTYLLEIDVPNYGIVSAETNIPLLPDTNAEYAGLAGSSKAGFYGGYRHFAVNDIEPQSITRSIIIKIYCTYKQISEGLIGDGVGNGEPYDYYTMNPFCDEANSGNDSFNVAMKGSSISYSDYIRIPYKNIKLAMPLAFSFANLYDKYQSIDMGIDDFGYPVSESIDYTPDNLVVEIIAPSDDYDKYIKSVYRQKKMNNTDPPIFCINIPVHSNIENGLGIFAGYSSSKTAHKIDYDEE